jgi:hypothetical protein
VKNKNKKQKNIIAESKGNNSEHSHRRMRVPFTLPPRQRCQKRLDGWRIVDDDDYNQSVGNPKQKV